MPQHGPHHHGPRGPHHGLGWIESDRKEATREQFGKEMQALGELIAANAEITFGDALIALPDGLTIESVFERNPHGKFVLRVHAEWPEFDAADRPSGGRSPRFGAPRRAAGEA